MFETSRMILFLTSAVLLAIMPGPGIFYVLARSIGGGRREGILSSAGTFLGGLVHVLAAALGVSAILAASALAFNVVRFTGAAYLVYLGVMMIWRRKREEPDLEDDPKAGPGSRRSPLVQGIVTEMLNPKTALFFLSFIPQFVSIQHGYVVAQFIVLGAISVTLNTSVDIVVAFFAGPIGARLKHHAAFRRRQRTASGVAMIGLGVYVAATDSR